MEILRYSRKYAMFPQLKHYITNWHLQKLTKKTVDRYGKILAHITDEDGWV